MVSSATELQLSFQGDLENWAEGMDYCAIAVPATITEVLGTKRPGDGASERVSALRVSLFPVGGGRHYIRIKAKVRAETNTVVGERNCVRFTVLGRGDVELPKDLMSA